MMNQTLDRAFLTIRTLAAITSVVKGIEDHVVLYAHINTSRDLNVEFRSLKTGIPRYQSIIIIKLLSINLTPSILKKSNSILT